MRRGFTLVELLVAMTIIIILGAMTLAAVNIAANGDRVPGASRQTQSMILGARDRAIYAGAARGVRLITDPDNDSLVTSFVFVEQRPPKESSDDRLRSGWAGESQNNLSVEDVAEVFQDPSTGQWWMVDKEPELSHLKRLVERGLIDDGCRAWFDGEKRWYVLADVTVRPDGHTIARLTRPFQGQPAGLTEYTNLRYKITLLPTVVPGEAPRTLPRGIAIDLASSKIPSHWYDPSTGNAIERMDILFNERGTIFEELASEGIVSLYITDIADHARGFNSTHVNLDVDGDGQPEERDGDERVLTLYTNSGTVVATPLDDTDTDGDGIRDDPFFLAETGGED